MKVLVNCTFEIDVKTGQMAVEKFGKCDITPLEDGSVKVSFPEVRQAIQTLDFTEQWDKDHHFVRGVS